MKKRKVTTTTLPYCACCKKLVDAKRRKRDTVCQCHERHPAATPKTPSSAEDAGHWRARMKEILSSTTDLVKIGSVLLHLTLSRASHEDTVDHALGLASHQSPATKKLSKIFKKTSELIHRLQVNYYYVIPLFSFGKDYPECTLNFCKHAGFIETYTREFKFNVLEHLTQLEEVARPIYKRVREYMDSDVFKKKPALEKNDFILSMQNTEFESPFKDIELFDEGDTEEDPEEDPEEDLVEEDDLEEEEEADDARESAAADVLVTLNETAEPARPLKARNARELQLMKMTEVLKFKVSRPSTCFAGETTCFAGERLT